MFGMKAFGAQAARRGYAKGGPVRGPGSGTSDDVPDEVQAGTYIMPADSTRQIGEGNLASMGARGMGGLMARAAGASKVPVNLSNGEFKLSPKQVHAIGVQALNQMKDATHTPAAQRGQGMKPQLFFADGGVVKDENKRQNSFGDAAAVASNPAVEQVSAAKTGATAQAPGGLAGASGVAAPTASAADSSRGGVTRVGNSYSGGNVGGNVSINGQTAGGGYMVADGGRARGMGVIAAAAPPAAAAVIPGPAVNPPAPIAASGSVSKTVGADGSVTYSGGNVGGDVSINGQSAGGGYMSHPGRLHRI